MIEGYGDHVVVFQDAPRDGRRRLRRQPDLAPPCSPEPDAPPMEAVAPQPTGHEPGQVELFGRGVLSFVTRPPQRRPPRRPSAQMVARTVGWRGRVRDGGAPHGPAHVVQRHHHQPPDRARRHGARGHPKIKNATGTTVNDVVLTKMAVPCALPPGTATSCRPTVSLLATVPPVREKSTREGGSQQGLRAVHKLGTDIEDALERLRDG